jgi:hypothetical protein
MEVEMTSEPFDTSASIAPPGSVAPPSRPAAPETKSVPVAIVLTLVFPGLGHWYAGEKDRAVAFGGATLLAVLLSLAQPLIGLAATIAFIWALLDTRHAVARRNARG